MMRLRYLLTVAVTFACTSASAVVEGDCTHHDATLGWLARSLSDYSAISCLGQPLQRHNAGRYWGEQFGKNASVVVYPGNTQDVSHAVKAASKSPLAQDFALVGGGHSMINASSAYGFVLDLSWMNKTNVVSLLNSNGTNVTAIEYQGGATWLQVQTAVNGSGWTPVGARVGSVGAGGFSLGGGIGFLGGAYGYAVDRLLQLEVVLPSGKTVLASRNNNHSDLFWAFQGGSGQFGVVTRFWQEAVPEPLEATIGIYYIEASDGDRMRLQTVEFFETNKDPFSVVYYSVGYLSDQTFAGSPAPESYKNRILVILVHFNNPEDPTQTSYNATFAPLFKGINTTNHIVQTTPYADLVAVGDLAFPYGYRRGFYGPQTSTISVEYLEDLAAAFFNYTDRLRARGDVPYGANHIVQYMSPGLNGHLPPSDAATAWPHAKAGHQTLFSPAWSSAHDDTLSVQANELLNSITYRRQAALGEFIADYPNYVSPEASGRRVWGDNVARLTQVKQKYDPHCLIRNGKVFASDGCIEGGWANVFP